MALTQISTQGIKDGTITGTDLATNVDLVDNQKLRLGNSQDLQIYYDPASGGSSFIDVTGSLQIHTSQLYINNEANTERLLRCTQNDSVELYFDGSKKFETTSTGVTVTGTINFGSGMGSGLNSNGFNINFADSNGSQDMAKFGASGDLQIYHDGSHSRIDEVGTGNLMIQSNNAVFIKKGTSENIATFNVDDAVELYFNNVKKFQTTNGGINITGSVACSGGASNNLSLPDNGKAKFGTSDDLQIFHDGTNSFIKDTAGASFNILATESIAIKTNNTEFAIACNKNGSVELYHDNSKKFETFNDGIKITGDVYPEADNTRDLGSDTLGWNSIWASTRFRGNDNVKLILGNAQDLQIYHDSANSYIQNSTGALRIYNHVLDVRNDTGNETILKGSANGSVELYYNNVKKLETTDVGITSLDTLITQGELRPGPDNDHSIGRSNRRYITIFAVNGSINTSDKNEKNTIIDSDLGLDFINKLKPKSYKWNKDDGKTHYGLIAQDLEETLTSLGKTIADFGGIYKEDDSPMGLGYSELIAPLIKAVQELSAEVAALKAA